MRLLTGLAQIQEGLAAKAEVGRPASDSKRNTKQGKVRMLVLTRKSEESIIIGDDVEELGIPPEDLRFLAIGFGDGVRDLCWRGEVGLGDAGFAGDEQFGYVGLHQVGGLVKQAHQSLHELPARPGHVEVDDIDVKAAAALRPDRGLEVAQRPLEAADFVTPVADGQ